MVLVDSSVVIDFLWSKDARTRQLLVALPAGICGVTRAEVLFGARNDAEINDLIEVLDSFFSLAIPDEVWTQTGIHLSLLRRAGLKLPLSDVVIASLAIHINAEVWTNDRHFTLMQSLLPTLRLFHAPVSHA